MNNKKEMINVNITGDNNLAKNNKQIDNSTNINKIISKGKNKEKKNRNLLPPQEPPTFENGGYVNQLDENFTHLRTIPEISNTSFIRPNLEKIYLENKTIDMFAYVSAHRKRDNRYVLYNLCSESMYLSDHVIVDDNDDLFTRIGQCIRFEGKSYPYGDKFSVTVENIRDLNSPGISLLGYKDKNILMDDIENVFRFISDISIGQRYELLNYLISKIEAYSIQLFSNKKFILGMICNFYFMGAINNDISTNKYMNKIDLTKERFIMIFSDILFRIECGLILNFIDLQERIIKLSLVAQGLPEKNVMKSNNKAFINFCELYKITNVEYIKKYMKDLYKWYDIDKVMKNINVQQTINEMRFAVASIIINS